jgi:chromosome partitioning protein
VARSIISVINQKGGVGKTTTAINLAAALVKKGKKILIIDLDPQGNATTGLGKSNNDEEKSVYNILIGKISAENAIQESSVKGLDLISSNVNLSGLEVETANDANRAFLLKEILKKENNSLFNDYETIFIDCPPSLNLLTVMSLVSADELLIPLQTEFFALEGITQLVKTIDRIKANLNPKLSIRGILLTMFDKRNKLSSQVDNEARQHFKDKVYKTVIPRNVRLSEAPSHGVPCLIYDKGCPGSKSYISLAEEFINQNNQFMGSAA